MPTYADMARYRRGPPSPHPFTVGAMLAAYTVGLMTNLTCVGLAPPLVLVTYPITGICLSRYIGRHMTWWGINSNIENVSAVKLHFLVAWPVSMPTFVLKVFIAKYL